MKKLLNYLKQRPHETETGYTQRLNLIVTVFALVLAVLAMIIKQLTTP